MLTENRREKEKLARREHILGAAQKLFATRGYHISTVDDIAEAAGLAKGTIYLYFKTKQELFLCLAKERLELMFKNIYSCLEQKTEYREKILEVVKTHLSFFEQNHDFFKIVMASRGHFDPGVKEDLHVKIMEGFHKYVRILGRAITGCGANLVTKDTAFLGGMLLGMTNSTIMQWMMMGQPKGLVKKADIICKIFFKGIFAE
ncbi:MAG: TetR/AcrR family transcriptional regulator [bacterium]